MAYRTNSTHPQRAAAFREALARVGIKVTPKGSVIEPQRASASATSREARSRVALG
jgi:hypothetical protein